MKIFLIRITFFIFPIIFLLMGTNYFMDAAKLFDKKYEQNIAKLILLDNNVTNISNYNERILQKELINGMKYPPEVIVIGSSRTMLLNSNNFSNKNFFNNSVSGATIEDIIGIYQLYIENNLVPDKIIIGLDPWTFNNNNELWRWKSIEEYHDKFLNKNNYLDHNFAFIENYYELFSISYFQSSIKNLPQIIAGNMEPVATSEKDNASNTKLNDGSLSYGYEYRNASPDEIQIKINNYIKSEIYGIENFEEISIDNWNKFLKLLEDFERRGIATELFLSPFPPQVFKTIASEYPLVLESEKLINELATSKNLRVWGSFNPHKLNFNNNYFYDGMHCTEEGIERVLMMHLN